MRLKALIFDVDGTLADTEEAHRGAFNSAFKHLRLDWNWSKPDYSRLLATTGGKERIAAHIETLPITAEEREKLKSRIGEIHEAKTRHFTQRVARGEVPLREGVKRLLDEAAEAHIPVCIASTTTFANIEALLRTSLGEKALDRFTVIAAGDQVARKKPAPDIYEFVLSQLGLPAHECVAIEDSENGVRAAKAAGLFTIVTPSYWTEGEDFSAADLVLDTIQAHGIREIDARLSARVSNAH